MIQDYLKAGYPVLMVRPHEPERFISSIVKRINGRTPYQWDLVRGYREMGNRAASHRFRLPGGQGERKGNLVPEERPLQAERTVDYIDPIPEKREKIEIR